MNVDVAIIGTGTAGLSARREAERNHKSWVLIDPGPFGTTCARVGCMPSKLLIAAAEAHHHVQGAATFGIRVPDGVTVDGRAVMQRVRAERDRFVGFVVEATDSMGPEKLIKGRAKFVGPTTLEIDTGQTIEAGSVVIATGSSPWVPGDLEPVKTRVILNDDVFEWDDLPDSVAVVGTGVIALEIGQALQRLGVRVTFFNPFDQVGPVTDPAIDAVVREVLGDELDLQVGVADLAYALGGDGVNVTWNAKGEAKSATFEWVLAAAGRRPNIVGLGLDKLGIELDRRGMPVAFDPTTMQLGELPVFFAGDVNGQRPLLHEAADEGRIAGRNAAGFPGDVLAHVRRTPLAIAFTDPNIAVAGKGYRELEEGTFAVGTVDYSDQGRSRVMNMNKGRVNIYGECGTGRILGAEFFGPRAEHTAHLIAWAIQQGMTVQRALQMPFYHPVVEEGIRTALRDVAVQLKLASKPCASGLECGPGV
ncbi:MAG: dihydrolipoamide dehydrogenase [Bradymonadia bacterium]|jgi:dihydrolipoamide dehydrogenase